jgi:hypothetical protein
MQTSMNILLLLNKLKVIIIIIFIPSFHPIKAIINYIKIS